MQGQLALLKQQKCCDLFALHYLIFHQICLINSSVGSVVWPRAWGEHRQGCTEELSPEFLVWVHLYPGLDYFTLSERNRQYSQTLAFSLFLSGKHPFPVLIFWTNPPKEAAMHILEEVYETAEWDRRGISVAWSSPGRGELQVQHNTYPSTSSQQALSR